MRHRSRTLVFSFGITLLIAPAREGTAQSRTQDLRRLSLEELMSVEVTTVSRTPETRARTPAAVHVITQEDIRRSGVTSLAEALRLAPGVHVARIDANKWAIGIRGFTDRLARSMLVMIDGRAVYSPLFAGTYWEVQDTLLEDVDRIEVIRGPGGTLWAANAVNGIINIITKDALHTQGTLISAGGGSEEQGFVGVRHGGRNGDRFFYRTYGKFFNRGSGFHSDGTDFDDWQMGQAGFRTDWNLASERTLTLQGDLYGGDAGQRSNITSYTPPYTQRVEHDTGLGGGNVLARWGGRAGKGSDVKLQAYYDRTKREEPTFQEIRHTLDLDFQHSVEPSATHQIVWGLGYRLTSSDTESAPTLQFLPNGRTDQLFSGFLQDDIGLIPDRLHLIVGSKLEHNDYSGVEAQPGARLLWTPWPGQSFVGSVTRAVRTPSRVEEDLELTTVLRGSTSGFLRLTPNKDFVPEKLIAYELGYRTQPVNRLFVTLSAFVNQHDDVLSTVVGTPFVEAAPPPPHVVLPVQFANGLHGNSHGLELTADLRTTNWWRCTGAYSFLDIELTRDAAGSDVSQERNLEGSSPHHQFQWQSSIDLPGDVDFDWLFRFVSELPGQGVRRYATSDLRVGWLVNPDLELAVVAKDLHQPHHLEFSGDDGNVEIQRSIYAKLTWRW